MKPAPDPSLAQQLDCVEGYMRGCALLAHPHAASPLRSELARFLTATGPEVLDTWVQLIGEAFGIQENQRPEVRCWMSDAMQRWIRHIAHPEDVETYTYLRDHARRGFISHFPASRFLAAQMKLCRFFADALRETYRADAATRDALLTLLEQEFNERVLNVTDFFVAGREEELREQEATYRKWVYNAPAGIFTLECETGAILEANWVGEQMAGFTREELTRLKIWDLVPLPEHAHVTRVLDDARGRGHSHREDLHLRVRDDTLLPVFFNAGLIEYGHHHFFQIICVDISDRKRLETQLIQSEKMAAIGQLAAGIAHEIRNPLGIITNALDDLGEVVDSHNPDVKEDLRIAKEEMARVQAIINNLLEFSRESRAELESVDVNDLLRKTLQLMNKSLQSSDVRVVTEFGPLRSCMANQNALRQVFLNLITNAVQAMPNGGELRLRTAPMLDGRIQLEVTDTGVGIPPEHLKDIFNPFFTTKAPGQGTGLGLSVVHSVVKRYRGDIRVQSQLDRGTTFTIEFPCPCESGGLLADAAVAL